MTHYLVWHSRLSMISSPLPRSLLFICWAANKWGYLLLFALINPEFPCFWNFAYLIFPLKMPKPPYRHIKVLFMPVCPPQPHTRALFFGNSQSPSLTNLYFIPCAMSIFICTNSLYSRMWGSLHRHYCPLLHNLLLPYIARAKRIQQALNNIS